MLVRNQLVRRGIGSDTFLSLASRAYVEKQELPCQCDDLAPIPTRCGVWSSQREQPLGVEGLPQVQLRKCVSMRRGFFTASMLW